MIGNNMIFILMFLVELICKHSCVEHILTESYLNQVLFRSHQILNYFESTVIDPTVDLIGCFRIAQGQLQMINQSSIDKLCEKINCSSQAIKMKIDNFDKRLQRLSNHISLRIMNNNRKETASLSRLEKLLMEPLHYNAPWKEFKMKLNHSLSLKTDIYETYDEDFGDRCYEKIFGTDTIVNSNCYIDKHCADFMIYREANGYSLSHKVLYGIIAKHLKCSTVTELTKYARNTTTQRMLEYDCLLIKNELNQIYELLVKNQTYEHYIISYQDLFSEHIMLCGLEGYYQVFQYKFFDLMIRWQHESGCLPLIKYIQRPDKQVQHCSSHMNSLTFAAFMVYFKMLVELQPTELIV